jgi:hypothetical protein
MRPGKGEIFVDFVGEEPQIAAAATLGDTGEFLGGEDDPCRVVRAVDPGV